MSPETIRLLISASSGIPIFFNPSLIIFQLYNLHAGVY